MGKLTLSDIQKQTGLTKEQIREAAVRYKEELTNGPVASDSKSSAPPLPKKARVKFSDRAKHKELADLDIIGFLRIEYGDWLDGTLTRRYLKKLDESAYTAVSRWLWIHKTPLPDDVKIPTEKEINDAILRFGRIPLKDAKRVAGMIRSRIQHGVPFPK